VDATYVVTQLDGKDVAGLAHGRDQQARLIDGLIDGLIADTSPDRSSVGARVR
jgi:hypothetical protein